MYRRRRELQKQQAIEVVRVYFTSATVRSLGTGWPVVGSYLIRDPPDSEASLLLHVMHSPVHS